MKTLHHEPRQVSYVNPPDFGETYSSYFKRIYSYFLYRTGYNHEVAVELTQETFLRAYNHLRVFKYEGHMYLPYLMAIAHNLLVNYYRKSKSVPLSQLEETQVPIESGTETERFIEREDLDRALSHLSPFERALVGLKYTRGMNIKDIAARIGRSAMATKLLLYRVRNKIRQDCAVKK